ncbi:MAG: hypothetical protein HUU20_07550 [Pirellulales bacterium]|nr:hypothetical protein [Pirellulales bacterium]
MIENGPNTMDAPLPEMPVAPKRRRWLTLLLAIVVFASGFVVGAGATLVVVRDRLIRAIRNPDAAPEEITAKLKRSLDLSESQAEQVEATVRERQLALQEIRREVQPRVEAEIDLLEERIAAVLGPEQKEKWHALVRRMRSTWIPPLPPDRGGEKSGARGVE